MPKRNATRGEIVTALCGMPFSLRKVAFTDLARNDAYVLRLNVPMSVWAEAEPLVRAVMNKYTYQGCRIICPQLS